MRMKAWLAALAVPLIGCTPNHLAGKSASIAPVVKVATVSPQAQRLFEAKMAALQNQVNSSSSGASFSGTIIWPYMGDENKFRYNVVKRLDGDTSQPDITSGETLREMRMLTISLAENVAGMRKEEGYSSEQANDIQFFTFAVDYPDDPGGTLLAHTLPSDLPSDFGKELVGQTDERRKRFADRAAY